MATIVRWRMILINFLDLILLRNPININGQILPPPIGTHLPLNHRIPHHKFLHT